MLSDLVNKNEKIFCKSEVVRYVANGVFATFVHYSVLTFSIQTVGIRSAAMANGLAAIVGIVTSFLGSKFYVFKNHGCFTIQAVKFVVLYACIALGHILILFLWTDCFGFDYRLGFMLATFFQMFISFIGNKLVVFK